MRIYENFEKTSENRLKTRSFYIPAGVSEYNLLNGVWDFAFFEDTNTACNQLKAFLDHK